MSSTVKVHSWHINIQVGDSAIHVLVDEAEKPKPKILGAVLIDGGKAHHVSVIKDVISKIETDYKLPDGDTNLKFDSVVVTHWDIDHWAGVMALFLDDYKDQLLTSAAYKEKIQESFTLYKKAILDASTPKIVYDATNQTDINTKFAQIPASKLAIVNVAIDNTTRETFDLIKACNERLAFQSKFLKYKTGFPASPQLQNDAPTFMVDVDDCLTNFYVPYMTKPGIGLVGPHQMDAVDADDAVVDDDDEPAPKPKRRKKGDPKPVKVTAGANDENAHSEGIATFRVNFDNKYLVNDKNSVAIRAPGIEYDLGFVFPVGNQWKRDRKRVWRFGLMARLFDKAADYLGAELFTNGPLGDNTTWKTLKNPVDLLKAGTKPLTVGQGPRMFIVAGDQYIIGNSPLLSATTKVTGKRVASPVNAAVPHDGLFFKPVQKVIDDPFNKGKRYDVRGPKDAKAKNSASIVTLVIEALTSQTTPAALADSFKIHHFLGGDALWDVEGALVVWMKNNLNPKNLGNWSVVSECMKLSHHGGKESTEVSLLGELAPNFILVSVAANGEYFHPHAEVLAFVDAAAASLRAGDEKTFMARGPGEYSWTDRYSPLLLTNYPGWFAKDTTSKYSLDTFQSHSKADKEFQNNLKALYALSGITKNIFQEFVAEYPDERVDYLVTTKGLAKPTKLTEDDKKDPVKVAARTATTTAWNDALKTETEARRKFIGTLIEKRWKYISTQLDTVKPKAWRLVLGYTAPSTAGARVKPRHQAWIEDNNWSSLPAPDLRKAKNPPDAPVYSPAAPDPTMFATVKAPPPPLGKGGRRKAIVAARPRALWARIGEVPGDLEGDEPPVTTKPDTSTTGTVAPLLAFAGTQFNITPAIRQVPMATPAPMIRVATVTSRFFVYGSIYTHVSSANLNEIVLTGGSPLDVFLSALDPGYWTTDTLLGPTGSDISIDAPWAQSVNSKALEIADLNLKASVTNQVAQATEISASITKDDRILRFSTNSTYDVMIGGSTKSGFSDAFYSGLSDQTDPGWNLLVLGLTSVSPTDPAASAAVVAAASTFTLGDLLKFFGPHWMEGVGDALNLPGFDTGLKFVLDTNAKSTRNCLAFQADSSYPIWLRLQFSVAQDSLDGFKAKFQERLSFLGAINISDACVICQKSSRTERREMPDANNQMQLVSMVSSISSSVCIQATVKISGLNLGLVLEYGADSTTLIVRFLDPTSIADALGWITSTLGINGDPSSILPGARHVYVRQVEVDLGNPSSDGDAFAKSSTVTLTLEVDIFGTAFFVNVTFPSFKLQANLWTDLRDETHPQMLPWYEDYQDIQPNPGAVLDPMGPSLINFLPDSMQNIQIPSAVDFRIIEADFEAWLDGNNNANIIFRGSLAPREPPSSGPSLDIDTLSFLATRIATGNDGEKSYDIEISTLFYLLPRDYDPDDPDSYAAQVSASVDVSDGVWTINAATYNLNFGALYNLFDDDASESVMDILDEFSIPRIEFQLVYDKSGFNLSLTGALRISVFELDIGYWYDSADKSWTFQGQLGVISDQAKITIADIVADFDTSIAEVLDEIEFIKNIAVPAINQDATDFDSAPIQFYMTHSNNAIIMWFQMEIDTDIGAFTFLFTQYKAVPQPDASGNKPPRQDPKRLLRVRLDQLPTLPNIPIVGSLGDGQPIDSISYMYVQDSAALKPGSKATSAGFSRDEIDAINETLQDRNVIRFRDTKSNLPSPQASTPAPATGTPATPDYVLLQGHHFIVVTDGQVILDHKFGSATPATSQSGGQSNVVSSNVVGRPVVRATGAAPSTPQATEEDSGATVGPNKKSFPGIPITIDNFGIQVKDKRLYLLIDATVMLGPIKLSLEGFGIGIPLSGISFAELKKPEVIAQFDVKLTGIGVYFNAPPVMIAGCFFHIDVPEYEAYRGGLAVSILPYTLLAVGSYQRTKPPQKEFKSVFVFARLDGPLFTLEFAEISGVSAGFGYNYDLRLPTAADVQDFPLVHGPESSNDPMTLLSSRPTERSSFVNWTTAKENSLWFAVGMKVDAFQVLTIDAAAILSFSADDVKIAIVGIASASMPPSAGKSKPPEAFIYVELGIVASLDIMGGSLYVAAQLTPNSYILAPDCHLTGGFAMCYWFGKNENAGDWVFTVGGYHPAFKKPPHYPDVPRLGISWNLSNVLTVRGESYFAICPKACMGGGRLLATFNSGPIFASFEAWASFLINFKPFFFVADIGINVAVGCNIDFWIVHIHIEASLGAELSLQGPPFGGVAHVHFWVMGFDVYFGDQNNTPPALSWNDFLPLIKQPGPGSALNNTAMCVIAIEKGSADEKSTTTGRDTGEKWFVRAGSFQFRVESKFPIDSMNYGTTFKGPVAQTDPIYGRPMQLQNPYKSQLTVNITAPGAEDNPNPWLVQPLIRSLPKALWAQYTTDEDPVHSGNNISTLLNGSTAADATIPHLVGFTFGSPDPKLPSWSFPEFNALAAMQEGVFQDGVVDKSEKPDRRFPLLGPPTSTDERPVLKPTPAAQTTDLPVDKKPDVWVDDATLTDGGYLDVGPSYDEIEDAWEGIDDNATQLVADAWGSVLGWWGPDVAGNGGLASTLIAKKPSWLMGDKGRFETFYLEAPWLTAALVSV